MTTLDETITTPAYIAEWFQRLQVQPLAQAVDDPAAAAVFSADMVVGFCQRGNLASARIGALTPLVVDLFRRAYAHGIRHFVLLQDTHHPQTPEFRAFPRIVCRVPKSRTPSRTSRLCPSPPCLP